MSDDKFLKFDNKKSRVDLIDPEFVLGVGDVLAYGAAKYGERNFELCEEPDRFFAACMRHLLAWQNGDLEDDETGKNHLLHAATNLAILFQITKDEEDLDEDDEDFLDEMSKGIEKEVDMAYEERVFARTIPPASAHEGEPNTGWNSDRTNINGDEG